MIMHVQYDLTLLPTHQNLRNHLQTTLETQLATTRPPRLALEIMLADLGTTMLLGTTQPTAVEIAVPPITKAILETSTVKANLVLDTRHITPDLAGELFTSEEYRNQYRLFYDSDPVSLVALPDLFGVTMLLPTFGIDATSSLKRFVNCCMLMIFEPCASFVFHFTFHTLGPRIMFHTVSIAHHPRLTLTLSPQLSVGSSSLF